MKLLGWMHRKFRQNSAEVPFKDLIIGGGNSCDEEHNNYPKASFGNYKHVKQQSHLQKEVRKSLDHDEYEEDSAGAMYELFHGFLAIGTLGSEASTTPTFAISVENITEKEDEVTENELKLINDELEKVLVLGADHDESSSISCGRSSHGSIITLSGGGGKPAAATLLEDQSNGNAVCPLQGYLFGSAIELSETTTTVAKKEHRTSLGELFQRTKLADQENNNFGPPKDQADKSAMHLMKKKLKKKMRSSTSTTVDSASAADRKLHKILHMFHRKVHPENSTGAQKCDKYQKKKTMNEGEGEGEEDILMMQPKRAVLSTENYMRQYKIQPNPLLGSCEEDSSENKEHWIKTDADYLVLEL
ncbi:hypothetical protein AAZX31_20G233800 [Glycine max]|uniref:Protein LAZY 1 n=2 Tax=Glycine subgen. Soja TaxID=1462606 RepID=I1NJE7_SOYBN|nr:protein LAZY 1 [Glycine max]XP_028221333.1 protein LAZY 1-like [Glycine soja]KAG4998833.1 hypothetical protein JHK87_019905 [Glycine soja]KAH1037865.1 hypothetical protein GYH30_056939 [Glycine max]KAH1192327.1 Protein LAZY 1 [Glycine max]KRG93127.1 hypothetical protein GLYMA_20G249200v4 [Glycine max]RZB45709.1 Protein LAZY 1 [Glycine soja]|eukprot:XP_006606602.1 protein LAZY 1 [Glycine max]